MAMAAGRLAANDGRDAEPDDEALDGRKPRAPAIRPAVRNSQLAGSVTGSEKR